MKVRWPLLLALVPGLAGAQGPRPAPELLRVHVLNVGQGDCTVIEGPADERGDRKVLVFDTGESSQQGNEAKHVLEPYLRNQLDDGPPGRPTVLIDYFVISHYHKDHMGAPTGDEGSGVFYLEEALGVKIGKIFDLGLDFDASGNGDRTYRDWVERNAVPREKLRFDQLGDKKQIDMGGGVWIEVLSVAAEVEGRGRVVADKWVATTSQNDFSIALVVHYGQFDFYSAGDLSGYLHESWGSWYHPIETASFPQLRPTEVYRVNHHGSQWSSNYPFLQRLQPSVALISCGKGHKHPNEYTVQRLLGWEDYWTGRPMGSDVYQTKNVDGFVLPEPHPHTGKTQTVASGHIVVESDGKRGFTVRLPSGEVRPYPLQDEAAYTDVPWNILKARARKAGDEADDKALRVSDREDAESGKVFAPRGNDPAGGED